MHHSEFDLLPPALGEPHFGEVLRLLAASPVKAVVLDDDPTGTQTVHGLDVLAEWNVPTLAAALTDPRPCFFVLTNTRSLPVDRAAAVNREFAFNLVAAAARVGAAFVVVSRGDSTLRGHFAAELGALSDVLGSSYEGIIVIPAFFEGGRYTVGDIHYVAEGDQLVPAADTEFARDRTFGYRQSSLPAWIEEKTEGAVRAKDVASIDLATLRGRDAAARVLSRLMALRQGDYLVVNATGYADLESFVHGLLLAESAGKRFLFRTAASFVRVRAGLLPRPLLSDGEFCRDGAEGGLVVAGSYTQRTTVQLDSLLTLPTVEGMELSVDLLADPAARKAEADRISAAAGAVIRQGRHVLVYTSRRLESALGRAGDLEAGEIVSECLAAIVRAITIQPKFLITKGGITSSDVATLGLGMKRARVLGQAAPGVPVWELGAETRFPGMKLVVWPGNVGEASALRDLVRLS